MIFRTSLIFVMWITSSFGQYSRQLPCLSEDDSSMFRLISVLNNKFERIAHQISISLGSNAESILSEVISIQQTIVPKLEELASSTETVSRNLTSTLSQVATHTTSLKQGIENQTSTLGEMNIIASNVNSGVADMLSALRQMQESCENIEQNGIQCTCSASERPCFPVSDVETDCGERIPHNCQEWKALGHNTNGVYTVYSVVLAQAFNVYCYMETDKSAFMIIQRRTDGSVNFNRTWEEYKEGFGNLEGEFWLGNKFIYALTSSGTFRLTIDMMTFAFARSSYEIENIKILGERTNYAIDFDRGSYLRSNSPFSTYDRNNVGSTTTRTTTTNCGQFSGGGWWYDAYSSSYQCGRTFLNGPYSTAESVEYGQGVTWPSTGNDVPLKFVEMKLN